MSEATKVVLGTIIVTVVISALLGLYFILA